MIRETGAREEREKKKGMLQNRASRVSAKRWDETVARCSGKPVISARGEKIQTFFGERRCRADFTPMHPEKRYTRRKVEHWCGWKDIGKKKKKTSAAPIRRNTTAAKKEFLQITGA